MIEVFDSNGLVKLGYEFFFNFVKLKEIIFEEKEV